MTHDKRFENQDIHDLIALIKGLEERIIELEKNLGNTLVIQPSDSYYWEHG